MPAENAGVAIGGAISRMGQGWNPAVQMIVDRKRQSAADQFNRILGIKQLENQAKASGRADEASGLAREKFEYEKGQDASSSIMDALIAGEESAEGKRQFGITSGINKTKAATAKAREERLGTPKKVDPTLGHKYFGEFIKGVESKQSDLVKSTGGIPLQGGVGVETARLDEKFKPMFLESGQRAMDTTRVDLKGQFDFKRSEAEAAGVKDQFDAIARKDPRTKDLIGKALSKEAPEGDSPVEGWTTKTKKGWRQLDSGYKANLMRSVDDDPESPTKGQTYGQMFWDAGYGDLIWGEDVPWESMDTEMKKTAIEAMIERIDTDTEPETTSLPFQKNIGG